MDSCLFNVHIPWEQILVGVIAGLVSGLTIHWLQIMNQRYTDRKKDFPFEVGVRPHVPNPQPSSTWWQISVSIYNRTNRFAVILFNLKDKDHSYISDFKISEGVVDGRSLDYLVIAPKSHHVYLILSRSRTSRILPTKLILFAYINGRDQTPPTEREYPLEFPEPK